MVQPVTQNPNKYSSSAEQTDDHGFLSKMDLKVMVIKI